ncbi:SIMPL domain-containing protein [Microbacterium sp. NPDC076911]|uniref:SIMPL domain-containing protein n=1 Tax=Microbacterium sp. NPDC076911 TaxID=3154958 RepID=UPI00341E5E1E
MSDVVISVRGEHEARIPPELATARISVRAEGPERGPLVEKITSLTKPVRNDLEARDANDTIIEWSSQRVSMWSDRPWSGDGQRLAPVHYASVDFSVVFSDFAALSWWATGVIEREGVELRTIDWRLTPQMHAATEKVVASAAVRHAVDRATAYAEAVGLTTVRPVEIADVGLLTRNVDADPAQGDRRLMATSFDGAPMADGQGLSLQPVDIVVSATVEARFSAS